MTEREKELMLRIKGEMYDDLYRDWLNCHEKIGYLREALKVAEAKLSCYEQRQKEANTTPAVRIIKGCDFYVN